MVASLKADGSDLQGITANFQQNLTYLAILRGDRGDAYREVVLNRFSWNEIQDLYAWVTPMVPDTINRPLERYAFAHMTELAGQPSRVLTPYRSLLEVAREGFAFSQELKDAVTRLDGTYNAD